MNSIDAFTTQIGEIDYPDFGSGKSYNINDFVEKIVAPQFENIQNIRALHQSILEYIQMEDATFFIRAYFSDPNKNYQLLRRGFLSQYQNGIKYAFCDNTFASLFSALKFTQSPISASMLAGYLNNKHVVCGFGETTHEKELAYYTSKNAFRPEYSKNRFYLAHIHPVSKEYVGLDFTDKRDCLFPQGKRHEWDNMDKTRYVNRTPSHEELKLLKAHFVRFTHPLNNFLVPNNDSLIYHKGTSTGKKRIGEEAELIHSISNFLKRRFPTEYAQMSQLIYPEKITSDKDKIEYIQWGGSLLFSNRKANNKNKPIKLRIKMKPEIENKQSKVVSTLDLLRRMSAEAFIYYYQPLKNNPEIDFETLASYSPNHATWTVPAKRTRASVAKRIFREGREKEALELISKMNIAPELIEKALGSLKESTN